jgi:Protein of unknown function (DUF3618)
VPRDPAVIQQQIENTRAELADTIDAIADIVSPRRVARRTAGQVKESFDQFKVKLRPPLEGEWSASDGEPRYLPDVVGSGPQLGRAVRWERVGAVAGLVVLMAVVAARRHHSSS